MKPYKFHQTRIHGRSEVTARIIVEEALGRKLKGSEEVHHADENPQNNTKENLVLCPTRAYHMLLHIRMKALDLCGHADYRSCTICKAYDDTKNLSTASNGNGQPRYWHKRCASAYQLKLYYARKARSGT